MNVDARVPMWIFLLAAGAGAVAGCVVFASPKAAVAAGIVSVAVWIAFAAFSSWHWSIRRRLAEHLGPGWRKAEVVTHKVRTGERVNIQSALDHLLADTWPADTHRLGFQSYEYDDEGGQIPSYEVGNLLVHNAEPKPIRWESMPRSTTETLDCAENALYLVRAAGHPVALAIQGKSQESRKRGLLHVIARDRLTARGALQEVLALSHKQSVYRGCVISVERHDRKSDDFGVQFHDLAPVPRDGIVLPEEVLHSIDRNVLGFFRHAELLRRCGQGVRHGVLLHGPPGTGKTLVTRYLARSVAPATVLLLTGRQYAFLKPTCQLARLLSPSLVVLEDADLIGSDRVHNPHKPLLHELMDEMDGLASGADVVFLLTTNRPEVLESALAGRPGRVDQAIYFPLPDLECRRRLFRQFASGLDTAGVDLEPLLVRTEGASPAFLKELFRRAALMAIERGMRGQPLPVTGEDFERGLRELLESGGALTRSFLGFPSR